MKCFMDIVFRFLQTYGSTLLKRNITFFDWFKSTNFSIDQQSIDKHGSRFALIGTKPLKKPWNVLSQKLTSDAFQEVSRNHNQGLYKIFCVATIRLSRFLKKITRFESEAEARLHLKLEHAQKELCRPRAESPFSSRFF